MANTGGDYSFYQATIDGINLVVLSWKSGATGAIPTGYPGSFVYSTREVKSVTRTGTGAITIALASAWWSAMLPPDYMNVQATYNGGTGATVCNVIQDNSTNVTTPQIEIQLANAAGTATDPSSGDVITLILKPVIKPSY